MNTTLAILSVSLSEATVLFLLFLLLIGWSLNQYRWLRWATAALVAIHLSAAILQAEEPTSATSLSATESAEEQADDGDRDWGRDDGIAVGLSATSKIIVGVGFIAIAGLVGWMVFHQKPDGTVHPYDEE